MNPETELLIISTVKAFMVRKQKEIADSKQHWDMTDSEVIEFYLREGLAAVQDLEAIGKSFDEECRRRGLH